MLYYSDRIINKDLSADMLNSNSAGLTCAHQGSTEVRSAEQTGRYMGQSDDYPSPT